MKFKIIENIRDNAIPNIEKLICYDENSSETVIQKLSIGDKIFKLEMFFRYDYPKISIDNKGRLNLSSTEFNDNTFELDGDDKHLPFQFGIVTGSFLLEKMDYLTTLKGCPRYVGGEFSVTNCESLTSLKHGPEIVGEGYFAYQNSLKTLEGAPKYTPKQFSVWENELTSLKGGPEYVGGGYTAQKNYLSNLEGAPIYVGMQFDIRQQTVFDFYSDFASYTKLKNLKGIPKYIGTLRMSENNDLNYDNINEIKYIESPIIGNIPIFNRKFIPTMIAPSSTNGLNLLNKTNKYFYFV